MIKRGVLMRFQILFKKQNCKSISALLDLGATQGLLNVPQNHVPVDLVKELGHVGLLRHEERALAIGHGLEELDGQAARAHLSRKPDPALAVIHHLRGLINTVADTSLGHEHGVRHLRLEPLNANDDVLLADVARGWALPEARVALEALGCELTVEELHDELSDHGALRWVPAAASQERVVEVLNVSIRDIVLTTATCPEGHLAAALLCRRGGGRRRGHKGQELPEEARHRRKDGDGQNRPSGAGHSEALVQGLRCLLLEPKWLWWAPP